MKKSASVVSSSACLPEFFIVSLKVIISGIFALIILSLGCLLYGNLPSRYVDKDNATDFKNEASAFYLYGWEGFAWGWTNNEGYMNIENYTPSAEIEVLVMGSSHMEALQIMQKDSASSLLDSCYGMKTYNIGLSNHFFETCASHLKAAVKKYRPSFVVLETRSVNLSDKTVTDIIHNRVRKKFAYNKGILSMLSGMSYFRLLYRQFREKFGAQKSPLKTPASPEFLSEMLAKLNEDVSLSGAKLIIAYHPSTSINKDGSLNILGDSEKVRQFSELCAENGIYFLDMTERFLSEYKKDYTLPYGFANTAVGVGHMNKEGHRMFADEIYKLIQRIEAES